MALLPILVGACTSAGVPATAAPPTTAAVATSAPPPVPTPTPTPVPTPSPEPTPDIAAMAKAYAASAATLTEGTLAVDAKFAGATTYDAYSALYAEVARLLGDAHARISAIELLQELDDAKTRLLKGFADARTELEKLADDPDYDPKDRLTEAQAAIAAAGGEIRKALGLPPAPTTKP